MNDFTERAGKWLWEKKSEILLQAVLIPFVQWLVTMLASWLIESDTIRGIGFYVTFVALVAGACFLIWSSKRPIDHIDGGTFGDSDPNDAKPNK